MSAFKKVLAIGVPALIGAAIVYFAFSFTVVPSSLLVYYAVELERGSAGVLEIKKSNKCKKGGHKGCLDFAKGKTGFIFFYMNGSKNKIRTCDDSSAKAVITKIELTTTGKTGKPDDVKGDYSINPDAWLRNDAFLKVQTDGVVYEEARANARTQAKLVNMNSHKASTGEKNFWYKVTATACEKNDGGTYDTWVTDPRGDNKGTY